MNTFAKLKSEVDKKVCPGIDRLLVNKLFEKQIARMDFDTLNPGIWITETVIDCIFELLTMKSHIHSLHNGKNQIFLLM